MLRELTTRMSLLRIRQALKSGQFLKGLNLATNLVSKSTDDVRAIVLLADAFLYCRQPKEAEHWYNCATKKANENSGLPTDDRIFLGAYISNRLLECAFFVNNVSKVPTTLVIKQINDLPASQSLRTLLFIDEKQTSVPRRYYSRNRRERERSLR